MFFFHSVQLSPAVLHIGDNGTSDHTQSNAERKTNGISHHADTSWKHMETPRSEIDISFLKELPNHNDSTAWILQRNQIEPPQKKILEFNLT